MVRAYVLMEVKQGKVEKVLNALSNMTEVKDFDAVTGNFDVIIHVEGIDQNDIGKFAVSRLGSLDGVQRSVTYNVVEF